MNDIVLREARREDLPAIIALLADDVLGSRREDTEPAAIGIYEASFQAIDRDPNQSLMVAVRADEVVGTFQLSFLAGLSHRGSLRGQIESVRVAKDLRGSGLGTRMIAWAVDRCRDRRCALVQLSTHRTRVDAHRFYDRLGFEATHVGYKLTL